MPSIHLILELDFSKRKTRAGMGERLIFFCITYRRWAQSTSYNVAHPACDLKGFTYLSPIHAYEFLSQYRSSTTSTPRQPMVEFLVFTSSRFPLQKSEEKFTPAETRTLKFRLSVHMCGLLPGQDNSSSRSVVFCLSPTSIPSRTPLIVGPTCDAI